jgi:PE-PPE domain
VTTPTKTVILLNPFGTDVTNFVNRTTGVVQLLNGTITNPGDTVFTLPYNEMVSSAANITTGVGLLNTYLTRTLVGEALIFAYSQGCQISDQWLSTFGESSTIPADQISFLNIGNADRKFGGFAFNNPAFDAVGWTAGIPSEKLKWKYTDFARQYDPIADFPQAAALQNALTELQVSATDANYLQDALNSLETVAANKGFTLCLENLVAGLLWVHTGTAGVIPNTGYEFVSLEQTANLFHTDTNGAVYGISPTFPIPLLGASTPLPQIDKQDRIQIEQAYSRVFGPMPLPSQDSLSFIF